MAIARMVKAEGPYSEGRGVWEYKETGVTGNGDSMLTPSKQNSVSVTVEPSGGSAKVQATTNPLADVEADTATWVDWSAGEVTEVTQGVCKPCTAVRVVVVSGTAKFTAVCRRSAS